MINRGYIKLIIENVEEFKTKLLDKYYSHLNRLNNREPFSNDDIRKLHLLGFNLNGIYLPNRLINEEFRPINYDKPFILISKSERYIRKMYQGLRTYFLNELYMYTLLRKYNLTELAPNIIEAGYDERRQQYYITLEYVANHYIRGCFNINNVLDLLCKIQILHDLKITHNDIKPDNFILDEFGKVKLIDFEYCKILYPFQKGRTMVTLNKHTPLYASLEKLMSRDIIPYNFTHEDDTWSIGITLIESYLGVDLFKRCNHISQLKTAIKNYINEEYITNHLIPENPDLGRLFSDIFENRPEVSNIIEQVIHLKFH